SVERALLGDSRLGLLGPGLPGRLRIVTQEVAVEAVTHVGDGLPGKELRDPRDLGDEMVHERPHVPIGAGRRIAPLVSLDGGDILPELVGRPEVEILRVGHRGHPPFVRSEPAYRVAHSLAETKEPFLLLVAVTLRSRWS